MTAYSFAHLRKVDVNEQIVDYLLKIDATLEPFGGRFLVHNTTPQILDGEFEGQLVIIEFPDADTARAWYASPAYQEILAHRVDNSVGGAGIVEGVPEGYRAAALGERLAGR